jgi:hypothetical protein
MPKSQKPELPRADISVEIDGKTYHGEYTVKIKSQLLHVSSSYGNKTTHTSSPSSYGTPLEDNQGMAKLVLSQIVSDYLREGRYHSSSEIVVLELSKNENEAIVVALEKTVHED